MIMPFQKQFVSAILDGTKFHTIREDKSDRWQIGIPMQMATGVRTKHYNCFAESEVSKFTRIKIRPEQKQVLISDDGIKWIGLDDSLISALAVNDGFADAAAFWDYFTEAIEDNGKLIYWSSIQRKGGDNE